MSKPCKQKRIIYFEKLKNQGSPGTILKKDYHYNDSLNIHFSQFSSND